MIVLGINRICKWCQITAGGRSYTRPIKEINGQLFFKFKKVWHPVVEYLSDYCEELFQEGGKILTRRINK